MPAGNQAAYPFGSPQPGANFGGSQQSVPSPAGTQTPAVGGAQNPFLPSVPGGSQLAPSTSPYNTGATGALEGSSLSGLLGFNPSRQSISAFRGAGFGKGIAQNLLNFLQSGAGFNPQVAQALIAALAPQLQQEQANMMEQFGHSGMEMSSPAAYGMAQLDSQAQLQYGQILANMYEQSVQNYMNVLLAGKKATQPDATKTQTFQGIASGIASLSGLKGPKL